MMWMSLSSSYITTTHMNWLPLCTWFHQFENEKVLTLLKPQPESKTKLGIYQLFMPSVGVIRWRQLMALGNRQQSKWQRGANHCSLWVMSPPIWAILHRKQQNSSQHVMVNMLRGTLQWQNVGRKSGPTKLVEEELQPPNFVHSHQHQLHFLKM